MQDWRRAITDRRRLDVNNKQLLVDHDIDDIGLEADGKPVPRKLLMPLDARHLLEQPISPVGEIEGCKEDLMRGRKRK